jgi:VWFA-related protein
MDPVNLPGAEGDAVVWPQVRMEVRFLVRKGEEVQETDAKNIRVIDNEMEVNGASIERERRPLSICLVVDQSGSLWDKASSQVAAARAAIAAMQPRDEIAIVVFSDRAMLKQDFTTDSEKLKLPLDQLKFWGSSKLFDTLIATNDKVFSHGRYKSHVLLVLSDGGNNESISDLRQTIDALSRIDGPTIYSMTMKSSEEERQDFKNLQDIATATGGDAVKVKDSKNVTEAVRMLMQEAHDRYLVVYTPVQQLRDGSLHKVEVKVDGISGSATEIRAVARREYYAPAK